MFNKIRKFIENEDGASMVEYGLLVSLIAIAVVGALTPIGTKLSTMFSHVAANIK